MSKAMREKGIGGRMETVGISETRTHLAKILKRVQAGEHITITKRGAPIAVLRPATDMPKQKPSETIAALRQFRQQHTLAGMSIKAMREEGRIIMEPQPDDLLKTGRGLLKTKGKALERLLADRKVDTE